MKQVKNVPQLRFSGFDDEWEEKKLNEYLEPSKQKNLDNKYSKNDVLSVSGEFGIVNQIEFQGRSFAGEYVNNYGVVETNDIVYTKSPLNANPYGIIKSNFGKTGIVSTLYAVYKSKNNVDPCFIQTYFDFNKRLNDYLRPLVRKGAKNDMKVSSEDALLGNVVFPSKLEQQKIGTFLSHVDSLIQAKTKKLESLKTVKKSLLQKCFPKAGEKVPEIRFAGFSGDWEEKKLGDVITVNSGKDYKHLDEGDIPVYGTGGYMLSVNAKLSDIDAVGIGRKGTIDNPLYLKAPFWTVDTLFFMTANNGFDLKFIYNLSQNIDWKSMDESTSIPSLSKNNIVDVDVLIPATLEEQQKIGQFFSKYDSLITAQQKEIDKLKDIKKSLLQKMFV